jgi:hypothetical protein
MDRYIKFKKDLVHGNKIFRSYFDKLDFAFRCIVYFSDAEIRQKTKRKSMTIIEQKSDVDFC